MVLALSDFFVWSFVHLSLKFETSGNAFSGSRLKDTEFVVGEVVLVYYFLAGKGFAWSRAQYHSFFVDRRATNPPRRKELGDFADPRRPSLSG